MLTPYLALHHALYRTWSFCSLSMEVTFALLAAAALSLILRWLVVSLTAANKQLECSKAKLATRTAALGKMQADFSVANERLAVFTTERKEGEHRLAEATAELVGEKTKTSRLTKEPDMAKKGLVKKDFVIKRQSTKLSDTVIMVVDQGNAALDLKRQLLKSRTKLDVSEICMNGTACQREKGLACARYDVDRSYTYHSVCEGGGCFGRKLSRRCP